MENSGHYEERDRGRWRSETSLRLFYKALKIGVVYDAQVPALSSQGQGCHFTQQSVGAKGVGFENGASLQGILSGS